MYFVDLNSMHVVDVNSVHFGNFRVNPMHVVEFSTEVDDVLWDEVDDIHWTQVNKRRLHEPTLKKNPSNIRPH